MYSDFLPFSLVSVVLSNNLLTDGDKIQKSMGGISSTNFM